MENVDTENVDMDMENVDMKNVDLVSHHFFIYLIDDVLFHIFNLPFTG